MFFLEINFPWFDPVFLDENYSIRFPHHRKVQSSFRTESWEPSKIKTTLFLDCENFVIFSKLQIKVGTRVFPGLVIPFRPALLCTHHLLVNKNGDEFLTYSELLFCSVWSSEISFKRQHQICLHFWYSFCSLRNLFVHVIAPSFCSSDIQSSAAGFIFPLLLFLLGSSKWSSGNVQTLCIKISYSGWNF